MEPTKKSENPLGTASAVISILGLTVCLIAVTWVYTLETRRSATAERIAAGEYKAGDLSPVTDRINAGLTALAQIVLYVVGLLVGGTLSLVGLALGLAGLQRQPTRPAIIGIGASLMSGLTLIGCFLMV